MASLFSLEYNNIIIDGSRVDIIANELSGTQGVEVRTSSDMNTIYNGGQIYKQLSGMRVISLSFSLSGNDAGDYFAIQSEILTAFSHSATDKTLTLTRWDGVSRQIQAHVVTEPDIQERGGYTTFSTTQVQLACPDVYFESDSLQTITLSGASQGGAPIPAPIPMPLLQLGDNDGSIMNDGNAEWFPVIRFDGELTSPVLTNLSTGVSLQINTNIQLGDFVDAFYTQKSPYILYNSTVPYFNNVVGRIPLVTVGNNVFRLTTGSASDSGSVTVTYRSTYKGL
jgi:hypothetical protein